MFWWIVAAAAAYFVKGLCGFANTLVFTSILSFTSDNVNITPTEIFLSYPTNFIVLFKERKNIKLKVFLPLSALVLLGCIPGIFFLKNANSGIVKVLFGLIIIYIGLEMLFRDIREARTKKKSKASKFTLLTIGLVSGILCGIYGIGALLGAYIGRVTNNIHEFKANICAVFFVEGTFRIIVYAFSGIFTIESLKIGLMLVPVMLIFLFLGLWSGKFINEKIAKKIVIIMLVLSGVALIINSRDSIYELYNNVMSYIKA
ncbi:MAG: sulfite exporter TauE/SafE family protein [Clostridia bacterium]|nr:sulfite exporter TauE/SafE family protein [Clostridia bacterium]